MARQTYLTTDPAALKPIAEALIFASEEPLPARLLVRFLAGEREDPKKESAEVASPDLADAGNEQEALATDGDAGEPQITTEDAPPMVPGDGGEIGAVDGDGNDEAADVEEIRQEQQEDIADDIPDEEIAGPELVDAGSGDVARLAEAVERAEDRADERAAGMLIGDGFGEPIDQRLLRRLIDELNLEYQETGRAFRIVEIAGGFQFATIREYGEYVALLSKEKNRRRLSPAALETLAIIAYRQPVGKPELESIRGVNSDQVLLSLLEKNLIAITGRADTVGRPLLYGTTDEFLRIFGLNSLSDLPKLREIEELMEEDAYSAERVETITIAESSDVEEIEARVGAAGRGPEEDPDALPHDETLVFDMTSGDAAPNEPGSDQPDVEEAIESPDAEEPAAEEPAAEEPAAGESMAEDALVEVWEIEEPLAEEPLMGDGVEDNALEDDALAEDLDRPEPEPSGLDDPDRDDEELEDPEPIDRENDENDESDSAAPPTSETEPVSESDREIDGAAFDSGGEAGGGEADDDGTDDDSGSKHVSHNHG